MRISYSYENQIPLSLALLLPSSYLYPAPLSSTPFPAPLLHYPLLRSSFTFSWTPPSLLASPNLMCFFQSSSHSVLLSSLPFLLPSSLPPLLSSNPPHHSLLLSPSPPLFLSSSLPPLLSSPSPFPPLFSSSSSFPLFESCGLPS